MRGMPAIGRSILIALAACAFGSAARASAPELPPELSIDVEAPHRRAEAELKARRAQDALESLARATTDPNQEQWDLGFVALDLQFDLVSASVAGTVSFTATVLTGPLDQVVLDLDAALTPSACTVSGGAASFSHVGDRLWIDLDRSYDVGEAIAFAVTYAGVPDASAGAFGVESANGQPLIWSLSEPFGARTWWPCKDTPSDKADSAAIAFTVPKPLIAVSNGSLRQVVDLGTTRRFEWFERYPIATYLVSIAAHPYVEQTVNWTPQVGAPMPVTVWSWSNVAGNALNAAHQTRDMLTVFEDVFGPYPFVQEKYGQAQFNWGGGMEHQTATSLCCWGIPGLIAHELAHQWFGDQVTCASFTDIWVNEGFATYAEALWREATEGWEGYIAEMLAIRYFGGGTIRVPEESLFDFGRVFDGGLSYNKAAWVLHMLRGVLGDPDFFAFLKAYAADPQVSYGVATTEDVRRVAETVSGRDLARFFTQWIDEPWCPTLGFSWETTPNGGGYDVAVEVVQLQSHLLYEMPITVRVTTASGSTDHVVDMDLATEQAVFASAELPLSVELDPDHWVLHVAEATVPAPTFDRGVLVVNGVDWASYGAEITSAYADSAFSGQQPFEFWDVFGTPAGGYVPQLPAPRGHGAIPPEVLGEYSSVVWVGNDYQGDLGYWIDAAILSYLRKGGNVLLLARRGSQFLTQARLDYLGAEFYGSTDATVGNASPLVAGLVPMAATATQSLVSPLALTGAPGTQSLFVDASLPSRSLGHWRPSDGTASVRSLGGHFAHFAGRPYRWSHASLRTNVEFVLGSFFGEPVGAVATPPSARSVSHLLEPTPNPFNPRVRLGFVLSQNERVRIDVYDARGRHVRSVLDADHPKGEFAVLWEGADDSGAPVASGTYTVLLRSDSASDHRRITLVR